MRQSRRSLKTYQLCHRVVSKNSEGGDVRGWSEPVEFEACIWQASGQLQAAQYGEKLPYVKNMQFTPRSDLTVGATAYLTDQDDVLLTDEDGDQLIYQLGMEVGDGVCVETSDEPDYIIQAINTDRKPVLVTLKAVVS